MLLHGGGRGHAVEQLHLHTEGRLLGVSTFPAGIRVIRDQPGSLEPMWDLKLLLLTFMYKLDSLYGSETIKK